MKTIILFLGLPGCGKGTQAQNLYKNFGIVGYSLGELLRSYASLDNHESAEVKKFIDNGLIVPGDLVNNIVKDLVAKPEKVCLLDGYPRNIEQAHYLHGYNSLRIVPFYFAIDNELLIQRIKNRVQCKKCDKIYSTSLFSATSFKCDWCKSVEFYKRSDDNEGVLIKRISQFQVNTKPVLDFYKSLNLLHEIDASQSVEVVSNKLNLIIKELDLDFRS
jgi:adenylate kinase